MMEGIVLHTPVKDRRNENKNGDQEEQWRRIYSVECGILIVGTGDRWGN